jgi:hypothetical protein
MTLTENEIRDRIKQPNPLIAQELGQAVKDDALCAMHAEIQTNESSIKALPDFKSWVKSIIVDEKFSVFCHLLNLPIATVEIVQNILSELKKVFEAQDRFIDYQFTSPELKKAFEAHLEKIGAVSYWHTKGFELMKTAPNSFLIIDLPDQQKGPKPEPYFYTITPDCVIDTYPTPDNKLEFIIFRQGKFIYAFDDVSFYKFDDNKDANYTLLAKVDHNLGYPPANTFWGTAMNTQTIIQKQNVILKSVGWLNSLLASIVMGEHLGWYAGFPIMIGYEHKCSYQDEFGNVCNGSGVIAWSDIHGNLQQMSCPQCSKARSMMYGPGSFHTAPAPATSDEPNLLDGVKITQPSTEGLKWMQENKDARIAWLTYNLIGIPDGVTAEAINEKQVVTQFESRVSVLNETTDNFERIIKFTTDTLARLQAGPGFKGSTVKLGKEYFLYSAEQLKQKREEAKTNGAAMYELATQRHAIIEAEYRNNPRMKQRQFILSWLEPYPDAVVNDLTALGIPSNLIKLKAGLDYYVSRFEREYTDVVSFMEPASLKTKMDFIRGVLLNYVDEDNALAGTPTEGGAGGGR